MKKVLLVQPSLQPPGGGNGVAAWVIEALKKEHEVSVLTWRPVDLDAINRYYGTCLTPLDFRTLMPSDRLRRLIDLVPAPLGLLKTSLLLHLCKKMKHEYDVIVGANNEADFGQPGIQYIHYPWNFQPRPPSDLRWYHGSRSFLRIYYHLCYRISGFSFDRMKQNLTLVNSDWIGRKVKDWHGIDSVTLHPPIAGDFPEIPWNTKEDGFVCIGRITPEKELETIISIIASVRRQVPHLHLHIIGTRDHPRYYHRIRLQAEANASWLFLEENVSREQLVRLTALHRYGIHGMKEEHFGMAVAEMVRSGCIVFIPKGGGQLEIIGDEDRLLYSSVQEAAEKIGRTLGRVEEQVLLRAYLRQRKDLFSAKRFVSRIQKLVRNFDSRRIPHGRFHEQPSSRP